MACYVRLMHGEDVAQVSKIDREAFPTLWPPANYKRELENRLAHYIVAYDAGEMVEESEVKAPLEKDLPGLGSRVRRLFNYNRFFRYQPPEPDKQYITGFAEVVGDMFPEIREGVVVRPSLGMEDLSLIRKGFIEMAVSDRYSRDVGKAKDLMKRMLRRVK